MGRHLSSLSSGLYVLGPVPSLMIGIYIDLDQIQATECPLLHRRLMDREFGSLGQSCDSDLPISCISNQICARHRDAHQLLSLAGSTQILPRPTSELPCTPSHPPFHRILPLLEHTSPVGKGRSLLETVKSEAGKKELSEWRS